MRGAAGFVNIFKQQQFVSGSYLNSTEIFSLTPKM